ncbi:MAG TPA: hypothetical protein VF950_07170 [Planctomycetota bacterium]
MTTLSLVLLAVAAGITKEDLRRLAALRVSDEAILLVVRAEGPVEPLSAEDLLDLRRAGLSARVVEYLATTSVPPLPGTRSLYWPRFHPGEVLPPTRPYWRRSPKVPRR